jgi:hypothetical protein
LRYPLHCERDVYTYALQAPHRTYSVGLAIDVLHNGVGRVAGEDVGASHRRLARVGLGVVKVVLDVRSFGLFASLRLEPLDEELGGVHLVLQGKNTRITLWQVTTHEHDSTKELTKRLPVMA